MVKIDKDKCIACGACVNICKKGFEMKDEKATIKDENADCIKEAAERCPVEAIILDN